MKWRRLAIGLLTTASGLALFLAIPLTPRVDAVSGLGNLGNLGISVGGIIALGGIALVVSALSEE
jgi:hypothetical protein